MQKFFRKYKKTEYFKHNSTTKTQIGHILRHESLLRDIIDERMMGKQREEGNGQKCSVTSPASPMRT